MRYSVAIPENVQEQAIRHLLRSDMQEDLCFAIWYPSKGAERKTALIKEIILPRNNERIVRGNASFLPGYFERSLKLALSKNAGLAFMHSHLGSGWQDMSSYDIAAELRQAPATKSVTNLPLVGLTIGTDAAWSARFWEKIATKSYKRFWCENVRVVGNQLKVTFADKLIPKPRFREELKRTISAWGEEKQGNLARLKIGIVGVGSMGVIVGEAMARMGIAYIKLLDFDSVERINLDRTLHATVYDIGKAKVEVLATSLRKSATAEEFNVLPLEFSIVEERGFREALDCDLLFCCVDRPWARSVLNFIAYAHLIPVVDGGVTVSLTNKKNLKGADWKAHIAAPSRRCLECLGQYDPGLVSAERFGDLDDPVYISSLPDEHPVKRNENVFAFSLSAASLQVLQFLSMFIAPLEISDIGEQNYHFLTGRMDVDENKRCVEGCPYRDLTALGDCAAFTVTGRHERAEEARKSREKR